MELIACRINADWDDVGGLLLARKLYPGAAAAMPAPQARLAEGDDGAARLRALFGFRAPEQIDAAQVNRLTLVGVRRAADLGALAALATEPRIELHVIDCRAGRDGDVTPDLEIVHPGGACTTVLTHLLAERGLSLTPVEATWALLGLYEKTGAFLLPATTAPDLRAAALLREWGADLDAVAEARRGELAPEQTQLLYDLARSARRLRFGAVEVVAAETAARADVAGVAPCVARLHALHGAPTTVALVTQSMGVALYAHSAGGLDLARLAAAFGGEGGPEALALDLPGRTAADARAALHAALQALAGAPLTAGDYAERVATISADADAARAQLHFLQTDANAAPVVDAEGRAVGVLDRAEVMRALHHGLRDWPVRELLAGPRVVVDAADDLDAVCAAVASGAPSIIPVLRRDRVVGALAWRPARSRAAGEAPASLDRSLARQLPREQFALLQRLGERAAAQGAAAYLVGGGVRDLLLGRPLLDLDVVFEGDAIAFARAAAEAWGGKAVVHEEFGTAALLVAAGRVDLATARREYYERPAALPVVAPAGVRDDAARRDFGVNALLADLRPARFGATLDFVGGFDDLRHRRIRTLHALSFVEDPTRLFRAARFAGRFGFELDEPTQGRFRAAVERGFVERLDSARLWKEMARLFAEEHPLPALEMLIHERVLAHVELPVEWTPELAPILRQTAKMLAWRRTSAADSVADEPRIWLAALTCTTPNPRKREFFQRLNLPGPVADRAFELPGQAHALAEDLTGAASPTVSSLAGLIRRASIDAALFAAAVADDDRVRRIVRYYLREWQLVKPEVTGDDLLALGAAPGPRFREILDAIRDARLDGRVRKRDDEVALAKEMLGNEQ